MSDVCVLGVGMHPWGKFSNKNFVDMALVAVQDALQDAGVEWKDIQALTSGVYSRGGLPGLLAGHQLASVLGDTGIPIANIYNACATAASTMRSAAQMIRSGMYDLVLALGVDMSPEGFLSMIGKGADPRDLDYLRWRVLGAPNPVYWALDCRRRMLEYGTTELHLAKVKHLCSQMGALNPRARYKKVFSIEEVMNSPMVCDPLRLYEICATSDGAAAAVLCSEAVAKRRTGHPVYLRAASLASSKFGDPAMRIPVLSAPVGPITDILSESRIAARMAYEEAGIGPEDLSFIELPDNSSWHYLSYIEVLGLCPPGEAERMLDDGSITLNGKIPVCPSGGVASFGEAVGAQGMAQVCELVWQLRGQCGPRQVPNARVGLGQVYGAQGNSGTVILST